MCLDDYYPIIASYLGPNKSCKFVGEEDCKTMACCTAVFVRHLKCTCRAHCNISFNRFHPINRVVGSCLQSHHSAFGCGSATLLSMFYFWHRALLKLKNEGFNIGKINLILMELLENVIGSLDTIIIRYNSKVEDCFLEMLPLAKLSLNNDAVSRKGQNSQRADLCDALSDVHFPSCSRHCINETAEKRSASATYIPLENMPSFNGLVNSLGHNNNFTTDLLTKAWSTQINDRKITYPHNREIWRFDATKITTLTVNSLPSNSKVVNGILVATCHENIEILSKSQIENIRTLLINGNITQTFVHKGVNLSENIKNATKLHAGLDYGSSKKSSWMSETLNVLKKIDVAMILASGKIDKDIITHLNLNQICAVSNVSAEALNAVASSTGASIASYVTDCDELNVATCISVSIESTYNTIGNKHLSANSYIILNLPSAFQTIVICHPVAEYLSCLEHSFWHIAYRLAHATAADKVLPGGCITEENVIKFLQSESGLDTESLLARKIITEGFQDFINVVKAKLYDEHSKICYRDIAEDVVFDDYVSKVECWRSAIRLACLVSQTDLIIITGDIEHCTEQINAYELGQL